MDPLTTVFLIFFNGSILLAVIMAGIKIAISDRYAAKEDHWRECEEYIEDINLLVDQYCSNGNEGNIVSIDKKMHKILSKMQRRMQYLDKWQFREIHNLREELMKSALTLDSKEGRTMVFDD